MTMDTAGKAVLFSGLTVLISLTAVMLVPSPAFRSMSLGIMLAVIFVLAATLTLLPAVLAKLGPKVDRLALPWVHSGEHRSARFAAWGERLWRRPLAVRHRRAGGPAPARAARPRPEDRHAVDQGGAGRRPLAPGLQPGAVGVRPGRHRPAAARHAAAARRNRSAAVAQRDPGIAQVMPAQTGSGGLALIQAVPKQDPSNGAVGHTIDRLRIGAATRHARRRRRGREPRPRAGAGGQDPARDRRGARARLPAPAGGAPGAADRGGRRAHQPARHRRGLRRRPPDLPGRRPPLAARLRAAGLPRRLGAGVLLRNDLRHLDGLHGVPAELGEGALGPLRAGTPARRWSAAWPTRAV